jgi:hypothetical protein
MHVRPPARLPRSRDTSLDLLEPPNKRIDYVYFIESGFASAA